LFESGLTILLSLSTIMKMQDMMQ